jgi:hypothetical protein
MNAQDTTHRLHQDRALCGQQRATLSPVDSVVDCPTCRALIALAERRRRDLVRRSVIVIGKLAAA